jgi:hypothetical protein
LLQPWDLRKTDEENAESVGERRPFANSFRVLHALYTCVPRVAEPTPGLKLGNAFGVKNCNAFGVKNCNAFGVKNCNAFGVKNCNAFGVKNCNAFGVKNCNAFGVRINVR